MTFIVNHEGKVFQKNLGQNTSITCSMKEYNPDSTWTEVKEGRGSRGRRVISDQLSQKVSGVSVQVSVLTPDKENKR